MNYNKILIVVAHPDDEVLGCGGLIDKLTKSKKKVRVVFIAEGSSCRYNEEFNKDIINKKISQRTNFAKKALKILKVKDFVFYNLKCGSLNIYPLIKINQIIEEEISKFCPDTIITHNSDDCNNDHNIINKSVMIASRPTSSSSIKNVLTFEVQSSTEWNFENNFKPNIFFDISDNIDKKINAFKMYYKTEGSSFPFPRSSKGLKILANYRGMQIGVKYAEAYKLIRSYQN